MRKKLKGFTLVELLAAMAIIAILIGLAGFGITIALRNSRDTQRKNALNNMQVAINDYYTKANQYPDKAVKTTTGIQFQYGGASVGDIVPTKGAAVALGGTATESTSSGAVYKYGTTSTGYILCAELESGTAEWFDLSTGGTCTTTPTTGGIVQ